MKIIDELKAYVKRKTHELGRYYLDNLYDELEQVYSKINTLEVQDAQLASSITDVKSTLDTSLNDAKKVMENNATETKTELRFMKEKDDKFDVGLAHCIQALDRLILKMNEDMEDAKRATLEASVQEARLLASDALEKAMEANERLQERSDDWDEKIEAKINGMIASHTALLDQSMEFRDAHNWGLAENLQKQFQEYKEDNDSRYERLSRTITKGHEDFLSSRDDFVSATEGMIGKLRAYTTEYDEYKKMQVEDTNALSALKAVVEQISTEMVQIKKDTNWKEPFDELSAELAEAVHTLNADETYHVEEFKLRVQGHEKVIQQYEAKVNDLMGELEIIDAQQKVISEMIKDKDTNYKDQLRSKASAMNVEGNFEEVNRTIQELSQAHLTTMQRMEELSKNIQVQAKNDIVEELNRLKEDVSSIKAAAVKKNSDVSKEVVVTVEKPSEKE